MFEIVCVLTGIVIAGGAAWIFSRTKDTLHPAIVMAPLFFYIYCLWPILLNAHGGLEAYTSPGNLTYVALLFLAAVACFYAGLATKAQFYPNVGRHLNLWAASLSPLIRQRIFWLSIVLGLVSVGAYWLMISNAGGFVAAYSQQKGGGSAESGYIGEAPLLSFPALLLLALSRQGLRRLRLADIAIAVLIASPHLLQGTFGGRRGPLFIVLAALFFAWCLAKGVRPTMRMVVIVIGIIGLAVIAVSSQRSNMYLGSQGEFESSRIWDEIAPKEVEPGNTYWAGVASVLTSDYFGDYYWGYRYFVTFLIRPIPRQIWPTKYEDMGADWLSIYGDYNEYSRFREALGVTLPGGVAIGSIADMYQEFSWGVLLVFYWLGRLFSYTWRKHRTIGGYWTVILCVMLVLSVYLPSQSFEAWAHRLLFITVLTYLVWRYWLKQPLELKVPRSAPRGAGPVPVPGWRRPG